MNSRTRLIVTALLAAVLAAPVFPAGSVLALSPEEHISRGGQAYDDGRLDDALKEFSRGMKEHPEYFNFPLGMAMTLERMGRLAEAEKYAREAVRLAPEDGVTRVRLGVILARQWKTQEAIAELKTALNLPIRNHGPSLAMYELGVTYDEAGDQENALKYLKDAVEYATPDTYPYGGEARKARAMALIGAIYIERGQFEEGAEPLQQAFKLDKQLFEDQRFLVAYGRLAEAAGQEICISIYTVAVNMDPGSYYGRVAMSRLLKAQPGFSMGWTSFQPLCVVNEAGLYSFLYPAAWDEAVIEDSSTSFHPGEGSPVQSAHATIQPAVSGVSMAKQADLDVSQGEFPDFRRKNTIRVEWPKDTYCDVFEFTGPDGARQIGTRTYYSLNGSYLKLVFIFRPGQDQEGLSLAKEIKATLTAWENKKL